MSWDLSQNTVSLSNPNFLWDGSIGLSLRVQAVVAGDYLGVWRDAGDVFDLIDAADFSDSTASMVNIGNPDYPLFGWMLSVPSSTPLYSYALSNGGLSTVRTSVRRWVV